MKVILSPNPYRDRGLRAALRAQDILRSGGVETAICLPFDLDVASHVDLPQNVVLQNLKTQLPDADMLLCFGGDGTILHAARAANAQGIPVLGVNMGSVGFMAEVEHSELDVLKKIVKGQYTVERRMMLAVSVRRGRETILRELALNDAVITKGAVARVIDLDISGDGVHLYEFSGDGVIFSTPTGSTAYSISAGGPIVEPTAENVLVTPICAHSLQARPLVLGRDRVVTATVGRMARKTAYLSVDGGRAFKLSAGDIVEARRAEGVTKLVRLSKNSFYETINQKLGKA